MNQETLKVIVQALAEKVEAQALTITDLNDHITRDHAEMDRMQYTITDLRRQGEWRGDLEHDLSYYRARCNQLEAEVRRLELVADPEKEGRINAYMRNHGESLLRFGKKIECIKGVREVSGWGLKESKDFVEAYKLPEVAPSSSEEESGPNTKRSSQSPAGVGVNAKKSA